MNIIPVQIGTKEFKVFPESQGLNSWDRTKSKLIESPPCSSALENSNSRIYRNQWGENSIGCLLNHSNDMQNAPQLTALFTRVYNSPKKLTDVSLKNLDKSFVVFSVRTLIDHTWIIHNDQFQQPNIDPLPEDFISDCAIWCLFHNKNQTSALKDVEYKGTKWQVRNQFYPYSVEWLRSLESMPQEVYSQLRSAKDTYVSTWLSGRTLSTEAQALLDAGRKMYEVFYREYANLNRTKYKLSYWDAGFYQIRNALLDAGKGLVELNAVKMAHNTLRAKLQPKVYEYGFLSPEIIYE